MRPQTATLPKQGKHILFNQLSGNHYVLSDDGKEIKVNKRGDLVAKFTNDFSGFVNFKQRKNRSVKDRAMMYTQPVLDYDKENGFVCPVGTKFSGYAQCPYNLKGEIPQFLKEGAFKETFEVNNSDKETNKEHCVSVMGPLSTSTSPGKTLNKFQSLKEFRKEIASSLKIGLVKDKFDQKSVGRFLKKQSKMTEDKPQQSKILKASQTYSSLHTHKRIKSMNSSTNASCHRQSNQHKSVHQLSYFQQSLSNIQRTQTPNYMQSNFSFTEFPANTFNQTSIKPSCYKSSCHNLRYVPKRRYIRAKREDNTVNLKEHQIGFKAEQMERKVVNKLKEELKIYQPVVKATEKKAQDVKKKAEDEKAKKKVPNPAVKK